MISLNHLTTHPPAFYYYRFLADGFEAGDFDDLAWVPLFKLFLCGPGDFDLERLAEEESKRNKRTFSICKRGSELNIVNSLSTLYRT